MKAENEKNKRLRSAAVTLVMLLGCIAVYLFTDSGWNDTKAAQADANATPPPVSLPGETEFLRAALPETAYTESAPWTFQFPLTQNSNASLRLTVREGVVCAFSLQLPAPQPPEALAKDAAAPEKKAHALLEAQYKEDAQRALSLYLTCARALDAPLRLTAADLDALRSELLTAIQSGKPQQCSLCGYTMRAHVDALATPPVLYGSLQAEEEKEKEKK